MDEVSVTLSVFFEAPFWVGLFERVERGRLTACKVTFGAEPRTNEVWEFILKHYCRLRFSPAVDVSVKAPPSNPKRVQREARRQTQSLCVGTKSQQALKLWQEQAKAEHTCSRRERDEAEKQRLYAMRQQKKKEKHRGK